MMKMKQCAANIGLAIWRLKCFYETFVEGSTAGILLNFCAKTPPHRLAEKRWLLEISLLISLTTMIVLIWINAQIAYR